MVDQSDVRNERAANVIRPWERSVLEKPTIFVGSSSEGLNIAKHLHVALEREVPCEVQVWSQGAFGASSYTLESLIDAADSVDFAILIATADDVTSSRGRSSPSPRDNVLFELGLFMGALGYRRVFILCPVTDPPVKLPSDLNGLTRLPEYNRRSDGNVEASLTAAVLAAKKQIVEQGVRARVPRANMGNKDTASAEPEPPPRRPEMPRYGFDSMFANTAPGRFAGKNQNRPAVHLRAVWRPADAAYVDHLTDPAAFVELAPTALFERWHEYYARHGGVGAAQPARLNAALTGDRCFVVEQDCARSSTDEPQASVRAAIALSDGEPIPRCIADLSLSMPHDPLPLDNVLGSVHDLARHAIATVALWFTSHFSVDLSLTGILELYAIAGGALLDGRPRDTLESYVDLGVLGGRSKNSPIRLEWASIVDAAESDVLPKVVAASITDALTNWGYFHPPIDLKERLGGLIGR